MELLVFQRVLDNEAVKAVMHSNYPAALRSIIDFSEKNGVTTKASKEFIINLLIDDDNILSQLLQNGMHIGEDLHRAALSDILQIYNEIFSAPIRYTSSGNDVRFCEGYKNSVKRLVDSDSPENLLENLCKHYRELGSGVLSRYSAFKYEEDIKGVVVDGKVTLDSLVGLDYQKEVLISNTKSFVRGNGGNNVLLFGDRGTGKSSCVKALLNEFKNEGLKMIEVPKHMINKIPELINHLAGRPGKYILFLDDLSFETHEAEYRALKIAMDGQLEIHPDNVLIYATSNRRHLIKENWADREGGEIHVNDNMQETLSLSERFGISLVFSAPNQSEYLNVVKELLLRHGIEMTPEIEKKAIVWQMNYGGRNPRLAKQFVSDYAVKEI